MFPGTPCLLLLLICLGCFTLCSAEASPGFVGRVTDNGLNYACQQAVLILQEELSRLRLPDFSGSFRVNVVGNVDYDFHGLKITTVTFLRPLSSIAPLPGSGLKVSIANAAAKLSGEWRVKKGHWFKDRGSFDLEVKNSISIGLKLGNDDIGRLTATTSECEAHISDVRIHISGRLGWLYNLFHKSIESRLRNTMESKMCTVVTDTVRSKLQPFLQSLPVTAQIDGVAGIDYSLVFPPVATQNSIDLNLKGEFFSMSQRSPSPFPAPAFSLPVERDRMVYFGISTYFFNTASNIYFDAGAMTFDITDNMIPKEFQIRLNTTSFASFVPQVGTLYPNMPMILKVSPSSAPSLSITPEALALTPVVHIQAFTILPDSNLAPLFLIQAATTLSVKVGVNSTRITGSLERLRLQLSLKHSDVGPFKVQIMQSLMNFYASRILLAQINARLAEGYPLPVLDHIQLSNLNLQPHKDFLLFGADVQYNR